MKLENPELTSTIVATKRQCVKEADMDTKERLAVVLAEANGMEMNTEGTHLRATLRNVSDFVCKLKGNRMDDYAVEVMATDAGWLWYDAGVLCQDAEHFWCDTALYGTVESLMKLVDASCGVENEDKQNA